MNENNNIEDLFRKGFEQFESDPGANAWSKIQQQLNAAPTSANEVSNSASSTGIGGTSLASSIVIGSLGVAAVAAYFIFQSIAEKPKENKVVPSEIHQTPVEELSTESPQELIEEKSELKEIKVEENKAIPVKVVSGTEEKNISEKTLKIIPESSNSSITETNEEKIESSSEQVAIEPSSNLLNSGDAEQTNNQSSSLPAIAKEDENAAMEERRKVGNPTAESSIEQKTEESSDWKVAIDNIFTPNQDNTNDVFFISDPDLEYLEVQIFNQAGKLVHQWVGVYGFWEGNLPDGSIAPEGMYVYIAILEKNGKRKVQRGSLTLKR